MSREEGGSDVPTAEESATIAREESATIARFADPRLGLLTGEDELRAWVAEGKAFNPPLSAEASIRRMIPTKHQGLVRDVAKMYRDRGLELDDLIGEGQIGLIRSARKYRPDRTYGDPPRPVKFCTYATWWLRQSMRRAVLGKSTAIHIPEHARQAMADLKAGRTINRFRAELARDAAKALSKQWYSGSHSGDSDAFSFGRMFVERRDPSRGREECGLLLASLSDRERFVIMARYEIGGDGRTLAEIGAELGVTWQRVQGIERDAKRKLHVAARRKMITYEGIFGEAG